jgi:hypothetical protein
LFFLHCRLFITYPIKINTNRLNEIINLCLYFIFLSSFLIATNQKIRIPVDECKRDYLDTI